MARVLTRIVGIALVVAGVAGLVFAIGAMFFLAQVEKNIVSVAQEQVALMDQALSATRDGLDVAEESLLGAVSTVKTLETTMSGVGDTVGSSVPAIENVSTMVGVKLPATIEATQETLESVAASSKTIDNVLGVMSAIPLLGLAAYEPDVPLSEGFENIAASLDGIPESLRLTQVQLATTNDNLAGLEESFDTMADNIGQIAVSIGNAQAVLQQYKGVIEQLQATMSWVSSSLPVWINWLRLGVSLLLVWLGIAQLALITQGWELVGRSRRLRPAEAEAEAPVPAPAL